ncbi:unnamed protein product [Adineta steineri]|uniref:C2 domain-containing protein n=1 Tax=Adineta steineri TaxID=433720 RepID=A0A819J3G2_9BILA|nr:unnamed protein product [Adineta steineri]
MIISIKVCCATDLISKIIKENDSGERALLVVCQSGTDVIAIFTDNIQLKPILFSYNMSGESTDSECRSAHNNSRSHSLLRQVRTKLRGKSSSRFRAATTTTSTTDESSSISLTHSKHQSFENIDNIKKRVSNQSTKKPQVAFSHRLSLLSQVKSHIIGTRKYRLTTPSNLNDDDNNNNFRSKRSISFFSETQLSSTGESTHNISAANTNGTSSEPITQIITQVSNGNVKTMILNGSLDMTVEEKETKPAEQAKHIEQVKPIELPKSAEQAKPVEQPKPAEQAKPAEQPKPTDQAKLANQAKPAEQPKPTEPAKPADQAKQVKPTEQAKQLKAVEQAKQADRTASPNRIDLSKFKDSLTERAKSVMPKATSIFSNSPPPTPINNPDQVYWTEICIERGNNLAVKDIGGSSDPYVKVVYGTEEKYTTNTVTKSLNPVWNEKFTIFTEDLTVPLYFNLYDQDRIGRDESMGSVKMDLWKLPFERLYNASLELENEERNDGKNGILKISVTITPKTVEFRDEVLRSLAKQSQTKSLFGGRSTNAGVILPRRTIDVFIVEGRKLKPNGVNKPCSPYVKIKFGNKKNRSATIKSTLNPQWHQSFMYDTFAGDLHPIELIVFDETGGSEQLVGRGLCNIAHLDEERTHRIPVDLEDDAGVIELFVTITQTTALQEATSDGDSSTNVALESMPSKLTEKDINHYTFLNTLKSMNPITDIGKLEIKIYQARDLSSKDLTGKSDPFCIVELDSTRLRTHTIYKTLDPVWSKSFVIPAQDIHSVVELTIFDEDTNKSTEFIGKVAIPLLAIKNGVKKWYQLKDQKCLLPVKGAIEIEATFVYTQLKAVIRTINPRQTAYYQIDEKFSIGAIKQSIARITNMMSGFINVMKFIDHTFHWENPYLSFGTFMAVLTMVWNFELWMAPCSLLLIFVRNLINEYQSGRLGTAFTGTGDELLPTLVQPSPEEDEVAEVDPNSKEPKKSFLGAITGIQDTIKELQGTIDGVASTLERLKNVFNFTVPWLSNLLMITLVLVSVLLYYVPLRALILAFFINKFTKYFRKPKGFIDNNEAADFISRLPSDPELMQYRELKVVARIPPAAKKTKK